VDKTSLQVIRAALNSAYMFATVEDLRQSYLDLEPNVQESKLTRSLRGALDIVENHLIIEEADSNGEERDATDDGADVESSPRGS
jgi:hypothetical protein